MTHDCRDVLLKAAELVAEEGRWTQHTFFRSRRNGQPMTLEGVIKRGRENEVGVCAIGAIRLSARLLGVRIDDKAYAETQLRRVLDRSVETWNDDEGRTADEVAEALRKAAE